jgi:hypothetical protein
VVIPQEAGSIPPVGNFSQICRLCNIYGFGLLW